MRCGCRRIFRIRDELLCAEVDHNLPMPLVNWLNQREARISWPARHSVSGLFLVGDILFDQVFQYIKWN
jgi:hypothetical protein